MFTTHSINPFKVQPFKVHRGTSLLFMITSLLVLCTPVANSAVYDVADDFMLSNPNSGWEYGYSVSLGSGFIPYAHSSTSYGGVGGVHRQSPSSGAIFPAIFKNTTANVLHPYGTVTIAPGQLGMHPGPLGEVAIARWTAPETTSIFFSGSFQGIGGVNTSTDVHIFHNSVSLFDGVIQGSSGASSLSLFSDSFSVNAGDVIDFALGYGGLNYFYDSTALDVQITTGSVVPLPPTIFMFLSGLFGLITLQNRKHTGTHVKMRSA